MAKPHIPMLAESSPRAGFFEYEQFEAIRAKIKPYYTNLVTFLYVTGWRTGEVFPLKWEQVNFEAGRVYLEPGTTKNKEARYFPFTSELRAALEEQLEYTKRLQRKRRIIIPNVFHRNGVPIQSFRKAFATACKNAGCPGRIPTSAAQRSGIWSGPVFRSGSQ